MISGKLEKRRCVITIFRPINLQICIYIEFPDFPVKRMSKILDNCFTRIDESQQQVLFIEKGIFDKNDSLAIGWIIFFYKVLFEIVRFEALLNVEKFSAFLKIPMPHTWLGTFQTSAACKQEHFRIWFDLWLS